MSNYIALAALLAVCFIGYMTDKYERKLKKQANELSERLSALERNIPTATVSKMFFKETPLEYLLDDISHRVSKTESCFRCPLYLNIVQAGTKQMIQQWNKEKQ